MRFIVWRRYKWVIIGLLILLILLLFLAVLLYSLPVGSPASCLGSVCVSVLGYLTWDSPIPLLRRMPHLAVVVSNLLLLEILM
jgi:hypothetical protein